MGSRTWRGLGATVLAVAWLVGGPLAAEEPVAHPGANDRFLDPELDVDEWQERFEGEAREIYTGRKAIVEALGVSPGMTVADVGSGTGLFLPLLSEAVGKQGRVYAVDVSPRFLEHLRKRVEAEGLDPVRVVEGGAKSANLLESAVDRILLIDTYHHFEYPDPMMESLFEAMRPGGELLVVDFERIPGTSRDWILEHMRADKQTFTREIAASGFELVGEVDVEKLEENYVLRFRRP